MVYSMSVNKERKMYKGHPYKEINLTRINSETDSIWRKTVYFLDEPGYVMPDLEAQTSLEDLYRLEDCGHFSVKLVQHLEIIK